MLKGKTVRVSAILRHTGELGWLKEVPKRVNAMLRLFGESLGLSGRKVGLGMKIQSLSASAFYTESPPVCLLRTSVMSVPRV